MLLPILQFFEGEYEIIIIILQIIMDPIVLKTEETAKI